MKLRTLSLVLLSALAVTACNEQTGKNPSTLSGNAAPMAAAPSTDTDHTKAMPTAPAAAEPNQTGSAGTSTGAAQ